MKGYRRTMKRKMQILLVLSSLLLLASSSYAVTDIYLVAKQFQKTLPDGTTVNMWGFATADASFTTIGAASSPGPRITVLPGETTLNIHLRNDLAVPVSIIIPGLPGGSLVPTWTDGTASTTRPAFDSRIRSLTHETAPTQTVIYTWQDTGLGGLKPGSYLYHSGTHQAVQVPMGLYGAVTKDEDAAPLAYAGIPYDNEVFLFYSEIDPALNEAVDPFGGGIPTYGTPVYPTTIDYAPKIFLLNGEPETHPGAVPLVAQTVIQTDETVLARFFNAGLKTRVPTLQNLYMEVIAEDGNLYPYPEQQYSIRLPAGRTTDALLSLDGSTCEYPIYDRRLYTNTVDGGIIASVGVANPLAADDYLSGTQGVPLTVPAPGLLANDTNCSATGALTINPADVVQPTNGTVSVDTLGSLTYTPTDATVTTDSFTYRATVATLQSNIATVNINLVAPPTTATLDVRVASSSDDAEERASGTMYLTSSDLEMTYDGGGNQKVGMRFNGITIPSGATITNAYIQFQVDETPSGTTNLTIRGEASANAPTFTSTDLNITNRTLTGASVPWSPPAWPNAGDQGIAQQTPDIKSIIQEIVGINGWADGNSLVIVITGTGERVAESFNGVSAAAPLLHVEYSFYAGTSYYCDGDGDGSISATPSGTCSGANCPPPLCQATPGNDCDDGNGAINPGALEICDGLDNDCNAGTADGSGEAAPPNSNQTGVCSGSVQSCTGGSWVDDYSGVTSYEATETTCDGSQDNDCDGLSDGVDPDCLAPPPSILLDVRVASSSDDAEERASGTMYLTSSDLEMTYDGGGNQKVGMRFNGITIPPGATITNAYIQFQVDETPSATTNLTIRGEASANAPTFTSTDLNITNRTLTGASVPWSPPAWSNAGDQGIAQQTPDIKSIIQEIVGITDWADGNSLVIVITGIGERVAESFNGVSAAAPLLHVEYIAGTSYYCDGDGDGSISATPSGTCSGANCPPPLCQATPGTDCDDGNGAINPGALEICDGLDNDCNAGTADGSGQTPEPNSNQLGVCAGSVQSCTGGAWVDDYSGVTSYEATETTCDGSQDNDCDGLSDGVDPDCLAPPPSIPLDVRVASSSDDAEERASGTMSLTSSDLEMTFDGGNQKVGMRFNGITIPPGATITNAYIQFQVDETPSATTNLTIQGEANSNAPTFTSTDLNITNRTLTGASVPWSPPFWSNAGDQGIDQQTPDIKSIIQEIVGINGWADGNSLVIVITGTGERVAESFNGVSAAAPLLHVEYAP